MPSHSDASEEKSSIHSSLKSLREGLRTELAASIENYKHQENTLELLITKSEQVKSHKQHEPEIPSITFKKFKPQ